MPYQVNNQSNDNASYDLAGSAFGDGGVFDFSDNAFITLDLESTSDAKGGNGGGKKPGGGGDGGGSTTPTYTYTSGPDDGTTGYNIEIQFMGDGWTDALMESFMSSADFLSLVITGDRPDYIAADDLNNFFDQDIDDILIIASLVNIDGESGVLGRAGPTHLIYESGETSADALPFAAIMEFDIADAEVYLEAGTWGDIVFHEMMHTLGFGTLWERTGVVDLVIDDNRTKKPVDDTYTYDYVGIYATDTNGDAPLVETDGGSGTAGGHWDETSYDTELMTGYIDDPNYLSAMSIASLADLGYEVDMLYVEDNLPDAYLV